jgi:hypothetical protein
VASARYRTYLNSMGKFVVSARHWPVVEVAYPAEVTNQDIDELAAAMRPLYERGMKSPLVTVSDLNLITMASSTAIVRDKLIEIVNTAMRLYPGAKIGEATVTRSQVVRAMAHAHYLFRRSDGVAHQVFTTTDEAMTWAKGLLRNHAARK